MDIVSKTIFYVEYDERLDMHIIKSFSYKAKLDMMCIKTIHQDLNEKGYKLKIHEMFKSIAELNVDVIASIILNVIKRSTKATDYEIMKVMDFNNAIELINKLMEISMPLNEKAETFEDEFEDDEDDLKDWDFDYMSYLWYSILKRNDDFYNITPKYYFKQIEIHKKFNGVKENEEKVEYI